MGSANAIDDQDLMLEALDTGQGWDLELLASEAGVSGRGDTASSLVVTRQERHRVDTATEGGTDDVLSTLKYFHLEIELQDPSGASAGYDGSRLQAQLLYDDLSVCEELSVTKEPPILSGGEDVRLEAGRATLRLRITVLSSLCNKRNFVVRVFLEDHPTLEAFTTSYKTITKLRRGSRGETVAAREAREAKYALSTVGATLSPPSRAASVSPLSLDDGTDVVACHKRILDLMEADLNEDVAGLKRSAGSTAGSTAGGGFKCERLDERLDEGSEKAASVCCSVHEEIGETYSANLLLGGPCTGGSLERMWAEISSNGSQLAALQTQQRELIKELKELKELKARQSGEALAQVV